MPQMSTDLITQVPSSSSPPLGRSDGRVVLPPPPHQRATPGRAASLTARHFRRLVAATPAGPVSTPYGRGNSCACTAINDMFESWVPSFRFACGGRRGYVAPVLGRTAGSIPVRMLVYLKTFGTYEAPLLKLWLQVWYRYIAYRLSDSDYSPDDPRPRLLDSGPGKLWLARSQDFSPPGLFGTLGSCLRVSVTAYRNCLVGPNLHSGLPRAWK